MRPRPTPLLVALALLALALAGCAAPPSETAQVRAEVLGIQVEASDAANRTFLRAQVRVTAGDVAVRDAGAMLWGGDASRNVLLAGQAFALDLAPGASQVVDYAQRTNGAGFPVFFQVATGDRGAVAWPRAADLAFQAGSREAVADATWGFTVPFFGDRQPFHFVVDATPVAGPSTQPVEGTLSVKVNGREQVFTEVALAPGQHRARALTLRVEDAVEVSWDGTPADVLVYVSDRVLARYLLEAGA